MSDHWQVQEAKQRFSELVRAVERDGPQFVTRHGREVAVVIEIEEFHQLRGDLPDFKEFLLAAPDIDQLDIDRPAEPARPIHLDPA